MGGYTRSHSSQSTVKESWKGNGCFYRVELATGRGRGNALAHGKSRVFEFPRIQLF